MAAADFVATDSVESPVVTAICWAVGEATTAAFTNVKTVPSTVMVSPMDRAPEEKATVVVFAS